jgi:hypothetical protein
MSDIVERLLLLAAVDNCQASIEAADTIARLTAENEKLRAALKEIARPTYGTEFNMSDEDRADILGRHLFAKQDLARAALSGDKQ